MILHMAYSRKKKTCYKKRSRRTRKPYVPRPEMKRVMRGLDSTLDSASMVGQTLQPFKEIDAGSGAEQRVGNQCIARGHLLSGVLRNKTNKTMIVRIIKLYNRRVNNSVVDVDSPIFLGLNEPASTIDLEFKATFAPSNREQYKFISDKRYKLGDDPTNGNNVKIIKDFTKFRHVCSYSNDNGENINKGNFQIYMFCYPADDNPQVADQVSVDFESTCFFNN